MTGKQQAKSGGGTGWPTKMLADCIEKVKVPTKIPRSSFLEEGNHPIISQEADFINGYWNDEADLVKVPEPVVVFGDHTQVLKLVDFDFVVGADGVKILKPKHFLDAGFLRFYLEANPFPSLGYARHYRHISTLGVPLPSLEEQKRIVAVLDQAFAALDRARAHAEANLADAKEFLESYVEGQLIASGGDVAALQALLDSGAITSHLDGNHGGDYPRKEEFISSGIPYISANCIVGQGIDFGRAKFLSRERAAQLRKGIAQDRDVIFAHNATVGPVALLQTHYDKVILGTSLTYYRCDPNKILPEFLVYEMRSANFRLQYEAVMKQATRNQVPITAQRKFSHTIPSIAEQRRIVEQCSEIERLSQRLVEHYAAELTDLANLRQSLLQKAFSGELT